MTNLTEYEKARSVGFIGIMGDIYEQQLTRFHAVLIENVEGLWVAYRVSWHEDGRVKKMVDLSKLGSFDDALAKAVEYIEWFNLKE